MAHDEPPITPEQGFKHASPGAIITSPHLEQLDASSQLEATLSRIDMVLDIAQQQLIDHINKDHGNIEKLEDFLRNGTVPSRTSPSDVVAKKLDNQFFQYQALIQSRLIIKAARTYALDAPKPIQEVFARSWIEESYDMRPQSLVSLEESLGHKATQQYKQLITSMQDSISDNNAAPLVKFLKQAMRIDVASTMPSTTNELRI